MNHPLVIKLSMPNSTNWRAFGFENIGFIGQTPGNLGVWKNLKFEINTECNECDIWIIYESVVDNEAVKVPKGNTILITSEEIHNRQYDVKFLSQFDQIVTSRDDINSAHTIKTYCCNAWFVRKTYDQLLENNPTKTKTLSVVASDLVRLDGHKKRFAFVNKLIGHFKDKIDVYGRGFNPINDKYDALAPYKYSITIENAQINNYWTEKIADCYLCKTMPIYYGCPNIDDYYDPSSYTSINIDDFYGSLQTIENVIEEDHYSKYEQHIASMKEKVLNELQFFPYVHRIIKENQQLFSGGTKHIKKIKSISHFEKKSQLKSKVADVLIAGKNLLKT